MVFMARGRNSKPFKDIFMLKADCTVSDYECMYIYGSQMCGWIVSSEKTIDRKD